jgi:hypothetical protein
MKTAVSPTLKCDLVLVLFTCSVDIFTIRQAWLKVLLLATGRVPIVQNSRNKGFYSIYGRCIITLKLTIKKFWYCFEPAANI